MNNLGYLFAAYTAIWLILGFYLFVLIKRNQKLGRLVNNLEKRLRAIQEDKAKPNPPREFE